MVKTLCFQYRGHGFDPWAGKFHVLGGTAPKKNAYKYVGGKQTAQAKEHASDCNRHFGEKKS